MVYDPVAPNSTRCVCVWKGQKHEEFFCPVELVTALYCSFYVDDVTPQTSSVRKQTGSLPATTVQIMENISSFVSKQVVCLKQTWFLVF
jgi:hypothetical protein